MKSSANAQSAPKPIVVWGGGGHGHVVVDLLRVLGGWDVVGFLDNLNPPGAQIMGVVHGLEKNAVLEHKAAIDRHLDASGIPVLHTAVFWGERSEIKPSEISPDLYRKWTEEVKSAPVLR